MAAAVRSRPLLTYVWFFLNLVNVILASPIGLSSNFANSHYILSTRDRSGVIINDADGSVAVFNSQTQQLIPQGSASDGGGAGFGAPAVLWVVVSFILGVPLAVAGIRGWRLTIGAAIGLSAAVCCECIQFVICSTGLTNPYKLAWAAFINTISSQGFSDIALDGLVFGFFALGFILGLFEFARVAGVACLGVLGGLAVGIRIVLFKSGLLVHVFFVNWLVVTGCAVLGLLLMLWTQRVGIVSFTFPTLSDLPEPIDFMKDVMHFVHGHLFYRPRRRSCS